MKFERTNSEGPVKLMISQDVVMPDPLEKAGDLRQFAENHDVMDVELERHPAGWLEPAQGGISTDLSYQAFYVPFDTIPPMQMSEGDVLRDVIRHTQKRGIRNHHPAVAQVVFQSLSEYPELANAYLQS